VQDPAFAFVEPHQPIVQSLNLINQSLTSLCFCIFSVS